MLQCCLLIGVAGINMQTFPVVSAQLLSLTTDVALICIAATASYRCNCAVVRKFALTSAAYQNNCLQKSYRPETILITDSSNVKSSTSKTCRHMLSSNTENAQGRLLQLRLPCEVRPDSSRAERSAATGHLLLTMPKEDTASNAADHVHTRYSSACNYKHITDNT